MDNSDKVLLIELSTPNHRSLIQAWLEINKSSRFDLFTTKNICNKLQIQKDLFNEVIVLKFTNLGELWRVCKNLKNRNYDRIVFVTLQSHIIKSLIFLAIGCPIDITIHNARTWFVVNRIHTPFHFLKLLGRKLWLQLCSHIYVNSSNMLEYSENKTKKPVSVVPFSINKNSEMKIFNYDVLKVIFPGEVNIRRKFYTNFLHLAKDYPNIQFILLGKFADHESRSELIMNKERDKLNNLITFDDYVSVEDFQSQMNDAALLFTDFNLFYENSDFFEIYGKTKDSGISYLMREYSLPSIISGNFKNFPELAEFTITFNDYKTLKYKFDILLADKNRIREMRLKMLNKK